MERPYDTSLALAQPGDVDVTIDSLEKDPEIYSSWMMWTLETGFADHDTGAMVDIVDKLNDMTAGHQGLSSETWPDGARQDLLAAARKMRTEIELRTKATVAELNLAREVYKDQLPDMFVRITDSNEWHLVEGFAMGGYSEVHPIIGGRPYKDFVVDVRQGTEEHEQIEDYQDD